MSVEIKEWNSGAELMEYSRQPPIAVVIGGDSEAPRKYYSVTVETSDGSRFDLSIFSSGTGIVPGVLENPVNEFIAVGYDNIICFIHTNSHRVTSRHVLDGVFFEFLTTLRSGDVVVVHELGLARLDIYGNVVWKLGTNILEKCTLVSHDAAAIYLLDGGDPLMVSLENGLVNKTDSRRD